VTARVGALNDRFLGLDRPLGEARLLWEIGPEGAELRELRARLGLDSGYVSRVLHSLESQGLVEVRPSASDGRVRRAQLTDAGLGERAELDRRSDRLAASLLEPLPDEGRAELAAAMAEVERLLIESMLSFGVEDPASADARWCFARYYAELERRFAAGFDPTRSIPVKPHELRPPAGAVLIARIGREPVGCGALKLRRDTPAELKRMWVTPRARGLGIGRRLLAELERYAAAAGAETLRLETNGSLTEAIRLYRSSGYREVEPFNEEPYGEHWFEKRLGV
jgi:DNA-binding MarR family transcriptional regulator/GNAT superfamily N-acetyltransferase